MLNISSILYCLAFFSILIGQTPTKIYWTDNGTDKIQRSNLDGSNIEDLVTGLSWPAGIAVDFQNSPNKIYWIDLSTPKIQRSNLDGSSVEDLVSDGLNSPYWIALDLQSNKMYWTDLGAGKIQRSNLDGTDVQELVTGLTTPQGIAINVSDGKMYWTDTGSRDIKRANLDGTDMEVLLTTEPAFPYGIALDVPNGKMYWVEQFSSKIQRANLNGSVVQNVVTSGITSPYGIAVDSENGKVYWTDYGYGSLNIQRADVTGSNLEELVTGLSDPYDVCLNYTSGSVDESLPVELSVFTATEDDGAVILEWQTACEINNFGFHIYRSAEEKGPYQRITTSLIEGAGNSSSSHKYIYRDNTCCEGFTYWYLLEDIDFSGAKERHGPIKISLNAGQLPNEFILFQNSPNPFNPITQIEFDVKESCLVNLKIYDIQGRIVTTLVDNYLDTGNYKVDFDGSNLGSGSYFYQVKMGNYISTKKMTLNR